MTYFVASRDRYNVFPVPGVELTGAGIKIRSLPYVPKPENLDFPATVDVVDSASKTLPARLHRSGLGGFCGGFY